MVRVGKVLENAGEAIDSATAELKPLTVKDAEGTVTIQY